MQRKQGVVLVVLLSGVGGELIIRMAWMSALLMRTRSAIAFGIVGWC